MRVLVCVRVVWCGGGVCASEVCAHGVWQAGRPLDLPTWMLMVVNFLRMASQFRAWALEVSARTTSSSDPRSSVARDRTWAAGNHRQRTTVSAQAGSTCARCAPLELLAAWGTARLRLPPLADSLLGAARCCLALTARAQQARARDSATWTASAVLVSSMRACVLVYASFSPLTAAKLNCAGPVPMMAWLRASEAAVGCCMALPLYYQSTPYSCYQQYDLQRLEAMWKPSAVSHMTFS